MIKMTKIATAALICIFMCLMPALSASSNGVLFQTAPINSLVQGVYDGSTTFKDLKNHGDFGSGTVEALDGEMVALDGKFYQIKSDGKAYLINDSMTTPFAQVTYFKQDNTISLNGTNNLTALQGYLDNKLPTKNIFYAIRIDGTFSYVKTRSVPIQNKPYPILSEAVKGQKIFEFNNVSGTIIGFRCPPYVNGVNVPGYHLHFITAERNAGGHLLDLKLTNVSVKVDSISKLEMILPHNDEFYQADLSGNPQAAINKIESNPKK
jgi:acetolactate decarboxylase